MENDPHRIPVVFMMDVIHGFRTIYPIPLALGCSFDAELVEACSRMAGKEAAASGVQVTFAPMVDYVRDPRWGRVMETCGEDPQLTGALAGLDVSIDSHLMAFAAEEARLLDRRVIIRQDDECGKTSESNYI